MHISITNIFIIIIYYSDVKFSKIWYFKAYLVEVTKNDDFDMCYKRYKTCILKERKKFKQSFRMWEFCEKLSHKIHLCVVLFLMKTLLLAKNTKSKFKLVTLNVEIFYDYLIIMNMLQYYYVKTSFLLVFIVLYFNHTMIFVDTQRPTLQHFYNLSYIVLTLLLICVDRIIKKILWKNRISILYVYKWGV